MDEENRIKKEMLLEKKNRAVEYIDDADQFLVRAMRWLSLALSIIRFGKERYDAKH